MGVTEERRTRPAWVGTGGGAGRGGSKQVEGVTVRTRDQQELVPTLMHRTAPATPPSPPSHSPSLLRPFQSPAIAAVAVVVVPVVAASRI